MKELLPGAGANQRADVHVPGGDDAGKRRFEQGRQKAWKKEQELLERLRALPDGEAKAEETKRMIDRVRAFTGYREYPKYGMISRYFVYKQALLEEAGRLVQTGVLHDKEDIFYLTFAELHDYVDANEYGGLTAWPFRVEDGWSDDDIDNMNQIQDTLDLWIRAGRPA